MVRAGVVLALLLFAATAQAAPQPSLTLLRSRPVELRGAGFHAGETVTLAVRGPWGLRISHTRTSSSGRFTASVSAVKISHCDGFFITATGRDGDRAVLRRPVPRCPIE